MASASSLLEWAPDSLYNGAISTIVTYYSTHRKDLKTLPENVQFDIHYKVSKTMKKTDVGREKKLPASIWQFHCQIIFFVLIRNIICIMLFLSLSWLYDFTKHTTLLRNQC